MSPRDQVFFAMELDVYQPGTLVQAFARGRNTHPRNTLTVLPQTPAAAATLRASDVGYRSLAADAGGVQVYPATMTQAFEVDRHVGLEPGNATTASFGSIRLSNLGQRFDAYTQTRNCDSRAVRLMMGSKALDSRGIYVDPPYASLAPFFGGTAAPWVLSETELDIPLRDATYWADRPLQSTFYAGTGGLQGGADLTGRPLPVTRGGTSAYPVQNVPLVTVDAPNLIYQWTDGPGTVVTLYEGAAAVFTYDGDVANLYAGATPASGHFRTNNARGLLQMGSTPVRALTADVTGAFAAAGAQSSAVALARYVLTETMAQPASMLDLASFAAAASAYPYTAGFWIGTDAVQGLSVVQSLLGGIGARLVPRRSGTLGVFVLRAIPAGAAQSFRFSTLNAIAVEPVALPSTLDPPPYRWRVGYARSNQVQTSDFNGAVVAARKTFVGTEYRFAGWSSSAVSTAWRRPNDPAPVDTPLLIQSEAQALADATGALWGNRPGLYAVEVPFDVAIGLEIGGVGTLDWPLRNLAGDKLGQIVGEQVRSYDATVKLFVLVDAP